MTRQATSARRRCFVEEIEPRVLYSADFAPVDLGAPVLTPDSEHRTLDAAGEFASDPTLQATPRRHEVVFVDGNTPERHELIDALQSSDEREIEIVLLDPDRDGVQQISEALAGRSGLDAVHILSHGESGALQLGSTTLDSDSLLANAAEIKAWGDALGEQADLLIYGCDVAGSAQGRSLLEALAALTGADVAASVDPTGNRVLGGDWDLEFATSSIETQSVATPAIQEEWLELLDLSALQPTQDTYIELRSPNDANNFGASTSIVVDRETTDLQRAFLQFDLSSIPTGSTINSATLKLQCTQIGGTLNISVYEVTEAWAEGTGTGTTGAANWTQRQSGTNWSTAGGTFDSTAVANINTNSTGQHTWDVTSLVQAWVIGTKVNNGLMVASPDGGGNRTATYDSSEGTTVPVLEIDYTPPSNTAPTLDASKSPALSPIAEDAGAPSGAVGTLVSQLVDFASPSGQLDNVTDPDAGAQLGIAVTGADTAHGSWWYSTDGGASWNTLGAVSDSSARLLAADADTRLYFQPNADYDGSVAAALTFRAWDGTSGVAGGIAAATADLSGRDNFAVISYTNNDGTAMWSAGWVDSDANPSAGNIVVSGGELVLSTFLGSDSIYREIDLSAATGATLSFAYNNQLGALGSVDLQVSANGGGSYATLATFSNMANTGAGTYTADLTPYLAANTRLRLVMNGILLGGSFHADNVEIAFTEPRTGGSFALSSASDTAGLVVTSVNDAPGGADNTMTTPEDTAYVFAVGDFGFSDADGNALAAVCISAVPGAGTLTDNGAAVTAGQFISAADIAAGLLRFTPAANANGTGSASFTFQVQDDGGTANGGVDLDPTARTMTLNVTAVNDPPLGAPAISGTVAEDETLTANTSAISDADGLGAFSYQWLREGVAVAGATSGTYTLGDADVGTQISVQVSYTDGHGTAESVTSAQTAAVANVNDAPTGAPTITGTVTEDQTLTANTGGIADADGLGAFSYQWLRDGVAIGGATSGTYTLGDADVGTQISVQVSYTDGHGTAESVTSAQTAAVANVNDVPTGVPTITGTVTEDQTLNADTSGIADSDGLGAFSYQWLRNGVAIGGATAGTYTLGDADVGTQISVQVSYTDGHGTAESVTSAQTAAVANVNDAPTGVPTITGTVTEDQTLTASTAGIADADGLGAFSYQWLRNGVAIGGATSSTYTLGDADVGTQISVQVSYTDGHGTSEGPLTSAQTAAVANVNDVPTGVPTITGTVTEDQTLTADTSGIADSDGLGAFSYQWLRNGVAIGGATASTYTLGDADVGTQISVQVSYTDGHGTAESVTSAQTAAVANVNDVPAGVPTISGTVTEDQTLTANTGGITDADGLGAFSYQWLRNGVAIGGATAGTYTLGDADVGTQISVQVSYTDAQGTSEGPLTSVQTAAVANVNDVPTGVPTITGTVTEDQTLTANTGGIADADGLGAFSYQWLRDGVAVAGATGATYTLGDADVGTQISVQVSYTDAQGTSEGPLTSVQTAAVANVNDAPVALALSNTSLNDSTDTSTGYSVGSLSITDVDVGDLHTYSVLGGADAAKFSVSADQLILTDGVLHFASQPSYQVTVRSTDTGGLYVDVTFTISVSPPTPTPAPMPMAPPPSMPPVIAPSSGPAEAIEPPPAVGPVAAPAASPEGGDGGEPGPAQVESPAAFTPDSADDPGDAGNQSEALPIRFAPGLSRAVSSSGSSGTTAQSAGEGRTSSVPASLATDAMFQAESALVTPAAAPEVIRLEEFRASLANRGWIDAVDQMRERFDKPLHAQQMLVGSSVAIGGGLSVGYIMWLLRGGLLLSSLLSSLPAWQSIDPLPVLSKRDDGEEDGADDSDPLERLFGRAKEALADIATGKHTAAPRTQDAAGSLPRNTGPATL